MKKLLFVLVFSFVGLATVLAQTRTITGKVTDNDGEALIGTTVLVKGTSTGTVTDIDGRYSVEVTGNPILVFSYTGYAAQEVQVGASNVVDVTMESASVAFEQIIVTGYGTKEKNQITGSTVRVSSEQLKDVPVPSVDQALQGKVAGLTMSTNSGTPGAVQDIRIRGVGSISAANDPLIVIDGVPVINNNLSGSSARSSLSPLAALNNADVESITVLKDASATSAYGARGSNGVIVITTKKGRAGQTKINFSSSYGFQNNAVEGRDVLTAAQREELFLEGIYNSFGASEGFSRAEAWDWAVENNVGGVSNFQRWISEGRPEGNWGEAIKNEDAPVAIVNISATGGDEVSNFYASLGYNKTEYTVKGGDFTRISGSLNYSRDFSKKFRFSTTNSVANTFQDGIRLEESAYFASPVAGKYFMSPLAQPYNEDGTLSTDLNGNFFNSLYLFENNVTWNRLTRIRSNNFLEWDILSNLKFKTLVGLDNNVVHYKNYGNRNHGDSVDENGTSSASIERNFNIVTQNSLDYSFTLGSDHRFDVKALMEYQENNNNYVSAYGENFSTDGLTNINQAGANWDAGSSYTDWTNLSYLGMLNYNYMGKYIADFTYRREGSSRFADDLRFGDFWSVGAAYNISEEPFMANATWLNNLKLRATYGVSGNSGVGLNQYQALLSYDADYAGQGAVYPGTYGNSLLTWEKNRNYDFGIDFTIINSRINGSFSYFNRETFDLLQNVPLTRTSGFNSITQNVGAVVNKGFEGILNFDVLRQNDFNISFSVNFATLDNEVTKLAKDGNGDDIVIQTSTRKIEVGHPIREWHMRQYAGVNPQTGAPQWYINSEEGDEVTEDYFEAEEVFIGTSAIPKFSGGTALHIDFKGVSLDVTTYFAGGHQVFEDWSFYQWHSGRYVTTLYQGVQDLMRRWQNPGDITDVPIHLHDYVANNASRPSDRFLFDGDFVRVKDLVLGYQLPQNVLSPLGIQGLQIYVRGTNLFTWVMDDDLKYDPEVRADGFTVFTTPPVKSVIFGLNLNF